MNSEEAYTKAFKCDPTSAFGGIIAFNCEVSKETAEKIAKQFAEVIIAPEFSQGALDILLQKKNLRLLTVAMGHARNDLDMKRIGGGLLVQTPDTQCVSEKDLKGCDETRSDQRSDFRHDVCVEDRQVHQVQHNRFCTRRYDIRCRRRSDEPRGFCSYRFD